MAELAMPPRLEPALRRLMAACREDERILAAWLEGSFAKGLADDWSDFDLHLLVAAPGEFDAVSWIGTLFSVVMADEIPGLPGALIFLTSDWIHIDLMLHSREDPLRDMPRKMLLDRHGVPLGAKAAVPVAGPARFPDQDVRIFLYFMGNTVTAVHRGDVIALLDVTSMMRDRLLVQLLLAENGIRAEATKRAISFLNAEQLAVLEGLPAAGVSLESQLHLQEAVVSEYLPRAKRLARLLGAEWPARLETAAVDLWARELGIVIKGPSPRR